MHYYLCGFKCRQINMNIVYVQRLAYSLGYGSLSISLDPIADLKTCGSWPYDLEGIGFAWTYRHGS